MLFCIAGYLLVFGVSLFRNAGYKRLITIESKKQYGVVVIKNVKYPTPYRLEQARIPYRVIGPFEYLLLPSGEFQESVLSALLKLSAFVLCAILVWRFDFNNPFQRSYLKYVYIIYELFVINILLEFVVGAYLTSWRNDFLFQSDYHLCGGPSMVSSHWLLWAVLSVAIYLYATAVKNKQEIDLTI